MLRVVFRPFRFVGLSAYLSTFALDALAQSTPKPSVAAPTPDFGANLLQLSLSLAAVIAMIFGTLWLMKKLSQQRGDGNAMMRVVAGTAVGARERVVIVEVGSTWLVLGVAPGRVSALAEIPRQATPPAERRPASAVPGDTGAHNFPDWLRRTMGNRDGS